MVQVGEHDPEREIQAMAIQKKIKEDCEACLSCAYVDSPGNALSWMAQADAKTILERFYLL